MRKFTRLSHFSANNKSCRIHATGNADLVYRCQHGQQRKCGCMHCQLGILFTFCIRNILVIIISIFYFLANYIYFVRSFGLANLDYPHLIPFSEGNTPQARLVDMNK